MSEKKTGGPAFPYSALQPDARGLAPTMYTDNRGMTLRDYFAAKALNTALLDSSKPDEIAKLAYEVADAMLAERDK